MNRTCLTTTLFLKYFANSYLTTKLLKKASQIQKRSFNMNGQLSRGAQQVSEIALQ